MSGYNARRAPNVSAYLADLNQIPDVTAPTGDLTLDHDLDFLTNTQFFDFDEFNDGGASVYDPQQGPAVDLQGAKNGTSGYSAGVIESRDVQGLTDIPPDQAFAFPDFQSFAPPPGIDSPHALQGPYGPAFPGLPHPGSKRKASILSSPATGADLEESSRAAAEEDKRRRNTAASARFRVKKKQREQALEKSTKEMTDKVSMLEGRVQQLETENRWLKELVTEKGVGVEGGLEGKRAAAASAAKVAARAAKTEAVAEKETSIGGRDDGVGTPEEE